MSHANLSRRSIVASAAVLPAFAMPAAASPSACTLPPDLIERFVRVRAWYLDSNARYRRQSEEIDKRFFATSAVTSKQWRAMDHDDPRFKELEALRDKIYAEVEECEGDEEISARTKERWAVAEAMLDHEPQSVADLAWQAEAWLLADLELFGQFGDPVLGTLVRHIRTLGALPQPDDPFGALTIATEDEEEDQS